MQRDELGELLVKAATGAWCCGVFVLVMNVVDWGGHQFLQHEDRKLGLHHDTTHYFITPVVCVVCFGAAGVALAAAVYFGRTAEDAQVTKQAPQPHAPMVDLADPLLVPLHERLAARKAAQTHVPQQPPSLRRFEQTAPPTVHAVARSPLVNFSIGVVGVVLSIAGIALSLLQLALQ